MMIVAQGASYLQKCVLPVSCMSVLPVKQLTLPSLITFIAFALAGVWLIYGIDGFYYH